MKLKKRNLKMVYLPEFKCWEVRYHIKKNITWAWSYSYKPSLSQIAYQVKDYIDWYKSL